jgi:hypothetical protein
MDKKRNWADDETRPHWNECQLPKHVKRIRSEAEHTTYEKTLEQRNRLISKEVGIYTECLKRNSAYFGLPLWLYDRRYQMRPEQTKTSHRRLLTRCIIRGTFSCLGHRGKSGVSSSANIVSPLLITSHIPSKTYGLPFQLIFLSYVVICGLFPIPHAKINVCVLFSI